MLDILTRVASMQRPKLLARAARFGAQEYRREVHLRRLLQTDALPRNAEALIKLTEIEADMNEKRLAREASYSIPRHVNVLIAITGEAGLLRRSADRLTAI